MRLKKPSSVWFRTQAARLWRWTKKKAAALPGLLVSTRFVTTLLVVAIAAELAVLGVGVVRRLEMAAKDYERATLAQLAAIEAQAFANDRERLKNTGEASIGTAVNLPPEESGDPKGAPPLRPRDPETVIAMETDDWIDNWENDLLGTDNAADAGEDTAATGTEGDDLGDADADELDHFIRTGLAALTAGDMRKCILNLEQARSIDANHPATLYYLGMAYDKLLNPDKARIYYTQVFNLRDAAGKYFERASRRLSFGIAQPSAMRGKLSFGAYGINHTYTDEEGEKVDILLPVLLAPGEEVNPDDIFIRIRFFDLVNNRRIEFAHEDPSLNWEKGELNWKDGEENLVVSYTAPPLTAQEKEAYGDLAYYGFVAKLYYKGEPLDCISTPSALILHEQRLLNSRSNTGGPRAPENSLLPEDGLEEAVPYSDFTDGLNES